MIQRINQGIADGKYYVISYETAKKLGLKGPVAKINRRGEIVGNNYPNHRKVVILNVLRTLNKPYGLEIINEAWRLTHANRAQ